MRDRFWRGSVAAAWVAVAAGCPKTVKNPNDSSKPSIELKVRGSDGQYAEASAWKLAATGGDQADLMCVVRDSDGVKQIDVSFDDKVDHCTLPNGAIYEGVFHVTPVPSTLIQTLQGDGSGQVLTSLPMLATVKGPFHCDVPGQGTGTPYGDELAVTCTGTNWSSTPADATASRVLKITLH